MTWVKTGLRNCVGGARTGCGTGIQANRDVNPSRPASGPNRMDGSGLRPDRTRRPRLRGAGWLVVRLRDRLRRDLERRRE
jgi:hypothetical protein